MKKDRQTIQNVLTPAQCSLLITLHKSVGVVGYRPGVRSTTLHDIVASAPREYLVPLVSHLTTGWTDTTCQHSNSGGCM